MTTAETAPGQTTWPDAETIDDAVQARLVRLGGQRLQRRMIEAFLTHTSARAEAIAEAGSNGDLQAMEIAAHSLKSSAGNLGAERLRHLCGALEGAASQGHGADVERLTRPTLEAYEAACMQLRAIQATIGGIP